MFAAPGYAVVAINPRGSTGYGQKFTDQISRDWTGRVYEDLMKGLDHALKTYPFLDGSRVAAAGGSYGGFMVNWIAGHTDRFQALISHAGVFDLTSKYGTTEELWFPEWEFGGPPWEQPEHYRERSPSQFVAQLQDADAGHPRGARLPGPRRAGARHVHRLPATGRPQPLPLLPRRGPLDPQARQPRRLVARGPGLAGEIPETRRAPMTHPSGARPSGSGPFSAVGARDAAQGSIFHAPLAMNEDCPVCHLQYGRGEPGYFTGAMYFSYALAIPLIALLTLIEYLFLPGWTLLRLVRPGDGDLRPPDPLDLAIFASDLDSFRPIFRPGVEVTHDRS